jgi:hypothetical protein
MYIYKCECCKYSTNIHCNYNKHIDTYKHIKAINCKQAHTSDVTGPNRTEQDLTGPNRTEQDLIGHNDNISTNIIDINDNDNINDRYRVKKMENILKKGYTSDKYNCIFCLKDYKTKQTLRRHLTNTCNLIPNNYKAKLILKHNSNTRTKNTLDIVLFSNNGKLITTDNKTIVNNNTNNIINNITQLNPVGKESIEHISFDRMVEIMCSGNRMIKEYCKEVYKIEENKNAYVDTRKKIIYFINDKNEVEIEHLNEMLSKMVDANVRKINKFYKDNVDNFTPRTKKLFEETYGNYFCIINLNNIDDSDYIENEHSIIKKDFNDDMWLSLYNIKDTSRRNLALEH